VKIATKLTILLIVLTTLVALTVGWFAVEASTRSQYTNLKDKINVVIRSGKGDSTAALSNALNVVQANSYDLTLDVIDPSGGVVQVNTGHVPLRKNPTIADVKATLKAVTSLPSLPGFRVRSVFIGGGDYLMVAGSTSQINEQGQHLVREVALTGLLVALVMMILARFVMRQDLSTLERLIGYASDVAKGDDQGQIPPSVGSRDVRELQSALATMVVALHQRIAIETRSVEAMQQFVGDASHELRTPLTVIKGYNELLTNPTMNEEQRIRAVDRVRREVDRMDALVADLLLSAEAREAPHHHDQHVALSTLVSARTEEFVSDHPERVVTRDIESGLAIRGREDLIDRLITNSFSNIIRHTSREIAVRVQLHLDGPNALLVIEDGGTGLPEYGVRPQRFRRFDESRSRETGGSGLGMSIMADIAEGLGGSMTTSQSSLGGLALNFTFVIED
jgi:two-component system OmpR family sensor kinase